MNLPQLLKLADLRPSKTNPRAHFDDAKLAELADSLVKHGFIHALLVRPSWCQGCSTEAEIAQARPAQFAGQYEIVDGERRFRAAKLAELSEVPCDVRELTDTRVMEVQLITFLMKESLSPLEESKGFQRLLNLKDESGSPIHTALSIAERVGKDETYVYARLKLSQLPDAAAKALDSGKIGVRLATLVARIPGQEMRDAATKEILHGMGNEPLSVREAERYVNEHCMIELKGAPFSLEDEALKPDAGSCAKCPHRTGNNRALFGDVKRGDICTLPACFRAKCDATWVRTTAEAKGLAGVTVLSAADSAALFVPYGDRTDLVYNSPYIDVDTKPSESLLKRDVVLAKVPLWRDLIEGQNVPLTWAVDGRNRRRVLARRDLAVTAAGENKEPIFASGAAKGTDVYAHSETIARRAQMAAHKKEQEYGFAATAAVRAAIVKQGLVEGLWPILLELALGHAGYDGTWFIAKRDGVKVATGNDNTTAALRRHLAKASPAALIAATIELLYSRAVRISGVAGDDDFKAIAKLYKVDLAAVKAALPKSGKPAKSAAAKAVAAVKASKPARKGGSK